MLWYDLIHDMLHAMICNDVFYAKIWHTLLYDICNDMIYDKI